MDREQVAQALVSGGMVVFGDIVFDGFLTIGGRVCGSVSTREGANGHVTLLRGGTIEGSLRSQTAMLGGTITGSVDATEHVTILVGAEIQGDVRYAAVELQSGAFVSGRFIRQDVEASGNVVVFKATIAEHVGPGLL
jgi:cytoskeletal protein CcmA (bactofilin family)